MKEEDKKVLTADSLDPEQEVKYVQLVIDRAVGENKAKLILERRKVVALEEIAKKGIQCHTSN